MDLLKQARENLEGTAKKMEQFNVAVGANPMTDEQRSEWTSLKEVRSAQLEVVERLTDAEEIKKSSIVTAKSEERNFQLENKQEVVPTQTKAVVKENRSATPEAAYVNTETLLQGVVSKNDYLIKEAQRSLVDGGHLPEMREGGFNTYQDSNGGIFVPTLISDKIFEMEQTYGVIPQFAQQFPITNHRLKIPSVLGRPSFFAVNEKSVIPGTGLTFGGIELDLLKWACIVDWTNEAGSETGGKILPILMRKMAEASAELKDNAAFNGDGTSTYHNLKGFVTLANEGVDYVSKTVATTGNTSFASLTAGDFLDLKYGVSPSVRTRGIYVMHPDMEKTLLNLEDSQGQYIYGGPAGNGGVPTLWGRPLYFSEAFPIADGVNKPAALFFDPSYFAYGNGAQMGVTRLSEAVITDESGNTINLATQDASALRFTQYFDFQASNVTTTTNGVAQGAFGVLFTAAS